MPGQARVAFKKEATNDKAMCVFMHTDFFISWMKKHKIKCDVVTGSMETK